MTDDLLKAREIVDDMDQAAIFGKAFPIREQIASAIRAARKALLQCPPPLHQPAAILQDNAFAVQSNSSERRAVS